MKLEVSWVAFEQVLKTKNLLLDLEIMHLCANHSHLIMQVGEDYLLMFYSEAHIKYL